MTEQKDKNFFRGITALVVGVVLALLGALWAHFAGLPRLDEFGRDLYPHIPRGYDEWPSKLLGQLVSLGGVLIAMAGATLAFLYNKKLTWARAAVGAGLFTGLMMILFGVIPNEWLTYTQAEWEWTSQKLWIRIPTSLLGGNELNISAAAIKDIIAAGYVTVLTGVVGAVMIGWQKREEILASRAKKKAAIADSKVSVYGRPLQKVER